MRWPWQRREQEVAPQPALPPRRDDAPRVSPMGWAFLPPLQRQLGDMPLVARTASFPSQLPAWQNPSLTGTLAHRVSTDAPSGVIDGDGGGTGEPTVQSASPDLTLLAPAPVRPQPVQRAVAQASSSNGGSRAVHAPLTTAAPTGLPVLAVQSYEAPVDPTTDTSPEVVTDVSEGDVGAEAGQPTEDAAPPAAESGPATASLSADSPALSTVQRSADASGPTSTVPSPTPSTARARPSVGGRRLGLGAPLPAMPLVSDVPPVQRSVDPAPALGTEGTDGYVEVDIPTRPSRPEESRATASAAAEPDVPTLGPVAPQPAEGLDTTPTPDPTTSAPLAMPVAPVQRSPVDTSDITSDVASDTVAPEQSEPPAHEGSAHSTASSEPAQSHTELAPIHEVPASGTADPGASEHAPTSTARTSDRPVLAQRSIATPADIVPAPAPLPDVVQVRPNDVVTAARELRHTGDQLSSSPQTPHVQRGVVGPPAGVPAGLTLQRSNESPNPPGSQDEPATGSVPPDDHGPVDVAPAPSDDTTRVDEMPGGDAEIVHPPAPPLVIAPTRPMLGTAAPLTSMATASIQRAEDTSDVSSQSESHWSPPTLTRTSGHAPTATSPAPQLRPTRHPTQSPSLQRATVGAHLQRSVDATHGSVTRPATSSSRGPSMMSTAPDSTGSPGPQLDSATPPLPLAAQSPAEELSVQTSLAEEPAEDPAVVPAEGATVPAATREAGGAGATSAAPGADAAAGASSPEQLEALAGRLFAPLMRRIRSEMLLDRERRGLRTDSW